MSENRMKKNIIARILVVVVIVSMIISLNGCKETKDQESGATLVYASVENDKNSQIHTIKIY